LTPLKLNGDLHLGGGWSSAGGNPAGRSACASKKIDRPFAEKKIRATKIPKKFCSRKNWREVVVDNPQKFKSSAELVGGTTVALREIVFWPRLKLGKPVVNREQGVAFRARRRIICCGEKNTWRESYYDQGPAFCGGIPLIKSLREGFVGNRINALYGIVNGHLQLHFDAQ